MKDCILKTKDVNITLISKDIYGYLDCQQCYIYIYCVIVHSVI